MENKKIREANLINGRQDLFGIYQIKPDKREYRFVDTEFMQKHNMEVHRENYELVYVAPLLFTDNPEKIFRRFNADRPEDFMGHSLSVSDMIVRNKGRLVSAVFTDIIGFTEVPHFIDEIRQANDIRIVEELEELRAGDTVKLYDGLELRIEEGQQIDWRGWERTQRGILKNGAEIAFHISETESVLSSEGVEFQRSPEPFLTGFYVVDNLNNPADSVKNMNLLRMLWRRMIACRCIARKPWARKTSTWAVLISSNVSTVRIVCAGTIDGRSTGRIQRYTPLLIEL